MAWTDIPAADVDVDSPIDEDLVAALRDNLIECRVCVLGIEVYEDTTNNTSWTTSATVYVWLPDLADQDGLQRSLTLTVELKVTGGGTGYFRLRDDGAAVNGDAPSTTSTSYEDEVSTVDFATGLKGSVRTILVQFYHSAGGGQTVEIKNENRATGVLVY